MAFLIELVQWSEFSVSAVLEGTPQTPHAHYQVGDSHQ